MRALGVIMAAVAILASAPSDGAAQSDLSGAWTLEVISDQGAAFSFDITIKQDEPDLTVTGEGGEFGRLELEGTLDDGNVRFAWDLDFQGTLVYIVFSGTVVDDGMSGSADFGGMAQGDWTAKRAEG